MKFILPVSLLLLSTLWGCYTTSFPDYPIEHPEKKIQVSKKKMTVVKNGNTVTLSEKKRETVYFYDEGKVAWSRTDHYQYKDTSYHLYKTTIDDPQNLDEGTKEPVKGSDFINATFRLTPSKNRITEQYSKIFSMDVDTDGSYRFWSGGGTVSDGENPITEHKGKYSIKGDTLKTYYYYRTYAAPAVLRCHRFVLNATRDTLFGTGIYQHCVLAAGE